MRNARLCAPTLCRRGSKRNVVASQRINLLCCCRRRRRRHEASEHTWNFCLPSGPVGAAAQTLSSLSSSARTIMLDIQMNLGTVSVCVCFRVWKMHAPPPSVAAVEGAKGSERARHTLPNFINGACEGFCAKLVFFENIDRWNMKFASTPSLFWEDFLLKQHFCVHKNTYYVCSNR